MIDQPEPVDENKARLERLVRHIATRDDCMEITTLACVIVEAAATLGGDKGKLALALASCDVAVNGFDKPQIQVLQ